MPYGQHFQLIYSIMIKMLYGQNRLWITSVISGESHITKRKICNTRSMHHFFILCTFSKQSRKKRLVTRSLHHNVMTCKWKRFSQVKPVRMWSPVKMKIKMKRKPKPKFHRYFEKKCLWVTFFMHFDFKLQKAFWCLRMWGGRRKRKASAADRTTPARKSDFKKILYR